MCFNGEELKGQLSAKKTSVVQVIWKPVSAELPCVSVLKMLLS